MTPLNSIKKQYTIKVTVMLENPFWIIGLFERSDNKGYGVAIPTHDVEQI